MKRLTGRLLRRMSLRLMVWADHIDGPSLPQALPWRLPDGDDVHVGFEP